MPPEESPERKATSRVHQRLTRALIVLILFAFSAWAGAEVEEELTVEDNRIDEYEGERCAEMNIELLSHPIENLPPDDVPPPNDGETDAEDEPNTTEDDTDASLETPRPTRWIEAKGRQCHRYLGRMVCEGPLKVALPHGEGLERAKRLGLGTSRAASLLQRGEHPREWAEEVIGIDDDSLRWPVDSGRFGRGYGMRRSRRGRRRLHKGVDIMARAGALIRSVSDGLVAYSGNGVSGYGNLMLIVHADSSVAFYAHCKANYVFSGLLVRRGQVIGEVGRTGLAQGDHLHFEIRVRGKARDPMPRFIEIPEGALRNRRSKSPTKKRR